MSPTAVPPVADEKIRDAVLQRLKTEPAADGWSVCASVDDGVATLTGLCESYAEKLTLERAVRRVKGVRAVANDIQVRIGPRSIIRST